jgi:hypothetical protein
MIASWSSELSVADPVVFEPVVPGLSDQVLSEPLPDLLATLLVAFWVTPETLSLTSGAFSLARSDACEAFCWTLGSCRSRLAWLLICW